MYIGSSGCMESMDSHDKVFAQVMCSKIRGIEKLSDLQQLSCDATSLVTSTPAGAAAAKLRRNRGPMSRRGSCQNKQRSVFDDPPSQEMEIQQIPSDATAANTSRME